MSVTVGAIWSVGDAEERFAEHVSAADALIRSNLSAASEPPSDSAPLLSATTTARAKSPAASARPVSQEKKPDLSSKKPAGKKGAVVEDAPKAPLFFDWERAYVAQSSTFGLEAVHPAVVDNLLKARPALGRRLFVVAGSLGTMTAPLARMFAENIGGIHIDVDELVEKELAENPTAPWVSLIADAREENRPLPDVALCRIVHAKLLELEATPLLDSVAAASLAGAPQAAHGAPPTQRSASLNPAASIQRSASQTNASKQQGDKAGHDSKQQQQLLLQQQQQALLQTDILQQLMQQHEQQEAEQRQQLAQLTDRKWCVLSGFPKNRAQAQYMADHAIRPARVAALRIANDKLLMQRAFPVDENTIVLPQEEEARLRVSAKSRKHVDDAIQYFANTLTIDLEHHPTPEAVMERLHELLNLRESLRRLTPHVAPPTAEMLAREADELATPIEETTVPVNQHNDAALGATRKGGDAKKLDSAKRDSQGTAAKGAGAKGDPKKKGAVAGTDPETWEHLADPAPLEPSKIAVRNWLVDSGTAACLALCIPRALRLREISLDACNLNGKSIAWICAAVKRSKTVLTLAIDNNGSIEPEGLDALADLIASTSQSVLAGGAMLRHLSLRGAKLTAEQVAPLASALALSKGLISLDISDNSSISAQGAALIANALVRNSALRHLDLSNTGIGDQGTLAVASVLWRVALDDTEKAAFLQQKAAAEAQAAERKKAEEDAAALLASKKGGAGGGAGGGGAAAAKKKKDDAVEVPDLMALLPKLDVDVGADGQPKTYYRPGNRTLEHLVLDNNRISLVGAEAIARTITRNLALKSVSLEMNLIPREMFPVIQQLFADRTQTGVEIVEKDPAPPAPPVKKEYKPFVLNLTDSTKGKGKGKGKGKADDPKKTLGASAAAASSLSSAKGAPASPGRPPSSAKK